MLRTIYGFDDLGRKVPTGSYDDGLNPVGGRIFYIDSNSDETVKFYDAQGNELNNVGVGDTPVYYKIKSAGVSGKEKYYIYDSTTGTSVTNRSWGYKGISTGATSDYIGSGKTNTALVLTVEDTSTSSSNSIWVTLKENNQNKVAGCDDWYIPSRVELMEVYNSSVLETSLGIWTSVEYNDYNSFRRYSGSGSYAADGKSWDTLVTYIAIRSF